MEAHSDAESYWNRSVSKAFSFDEEDGEATQFKGYRFDSCILDDDNISEASFENTLNTLSFTIRAVISETDVETILNEQLIENNITSKGIAPDEELKLLRRKLQNVTHEPALNVTASILLQGKLCSLEVYRSLFEKEKLLDEILQKGNGDGAIGVILFLYKTLNKKQFYRILRRRVKACDHYVNYLIQTKNKEAIETLTIFGRYQEAALFRFKGAVSQSDIAIKKQRLQQLIVSYYLDSGMVSIFDQIFNNALKLIQLIENAKGNLSDNINSSSSSLEVLYSCCSNYKWKNTDINELLSPFKIASDHQISSAQFEWTALNERANSQSFSELSNIFEKSSWHSITKQFHISISLETAIQRLSDLRAPLQVLYLFLSKINNPNQKLIISKRVCCTKATVDALASLKDVQELELLRDTLVKGSEEWFYCEQVLRNTKKKWSTDGLKIIL